MTVGPRRADLFVALAGVAFGLAAVAMAGAGSAATAALIGAALGGARLYPRTTWMLVAAVVAATSLQGDLTLGDDLGLYGLVAAHAFCAGRWDGQWRGLGGPIALIGTSELSIALVHGGVGLFFFIVPAAWGAGRALREREQLATSLAERARELDEEREAHARLSVRYERARIASELHDIVAHAISVMVVQASAGQRLAGHDPDAAAETFEAIAGAAREAEEDMGRLVALLGDEAAIGPAPDLGLIDELVARAAGSGLDVRLRLEGEREGLEAPAAEAAYRVVQEGLTNALRYASGAAVSVGISGRADGLVVEVVNAPAAGAVELAGMSTGHGLIGLRERVGACGGTVESGPTSVGGWRLCARLPRRAPVSTS